MIYKQEKAGPSLDESLDGETTLPFGTGAVG